MMDVTSIPGVDRVHPRSVVATGRYPITGPSVAAGAIDTAVIHYTAADDLIDGDPGEHAEDLPAYLQAINRHYWTTRRPPHSIGYRWAVDWLGGVWQLRGWDLRSAANRGHNGHTEPILVLVDGDDPATPEAVVSVRAIIAASGLRAGRHLEIVGHGDIGSSSCPGRGLAGQVAAGVFDPRLHPITSPQEDDMLVACINVDGNPEWVHVADGIHRRGMPRAAFDAQVAAGVEFRWLGSQPRAFVESRGVEV